MKWFFSILMLTSFALNLRASDNLELSANEFNMLIELNENSDNDPLIFDVVPENISVKFKRGKAILFTVFTGLLGGHRVYFGTHQRTPIIYAVTLGGLGILPLVDLVNILFTKDLSKFDNKTQVIMWGN